MLTVERFPTAASFLAGVEPFLLQAEVENNLILGIAHGLAPLPASESPPAWFAAVRDPALQGCAFSSVPEKLGLTRCTSREAVTALARDAAVACPRVTHIIGPEPTVAAFAEDFGTQLGRAVRREMAQRIHSLSVVEPPAPRPPGQLRLAQQADLPLVIDWVGAFMADVGETAGNPEAVAADRIAAGLLYLWDHAGPVSMAGVTGRTPHGVRIALVYTPPQQRGRGYASACVGGLSQRMLESGFRFCCLYTDLANPTSNAIYHRLGYRPVCDSAMYLVEEPAFDRSAENPPRQVASLWHTPRTRWGPTTCAGRTAAPCSTVPRQIAGTLRPASTRPTAPQASAEAPSSSISGTRRTTWSTPSASPARAG